MPRKRLTPASPERPRRAERADPRGPARIAEEGEEVEMRRLVGSFDAGPPPPEILDPIVRAALEEDHAFDDRSTRPLPA